MKPLHGLLFASAAILIVGGTAIGVVVVNTRPDVGEFDRVATKRIRALCGQRTDCQVRLRDLSALDWDELHEWNNNFSDPDVSSAAGRPFKRQREFGRVILLTKGGQVVYLGEGDEGVEGAIAGVVYLKCRYHSDSLTVCPADALMQVQSFHSVGDEARGIPWSGTSYLLHQIY